MYKFTLKAFDFIKNLLYFFKIVCLFLILILLMYWTAALGDFSWNWMNVFSPLMSYLVHLGSLLYSGSITIFSATFEYKYVGALAIIMLVYLLDHIATKLVIRLEELYEDGVIWYKKNEEKKFNKMMTFQQTTEQKTIKNYAVYISTQPKNNFSVNLDEQNKTLNKFLIDRTGVLPEVFENGFLYKFSNFEGIDGTLETLFKVLHSEAPINYIIAVHSYAGNFNDEKENLIKLIKLGFVNKISMFAQTSYRYEFKDTKKYEIAHLGTYQKDNSTIDAMCFVEKN